MKFLGTSFVLGWLILSGVALAALEKAGALEFITAGCGGCHNGALVGGASLKADDFLAIARAAEGAA